MSSRGGDISAFPWLASTKPKADNRQQVVATDELANRAGLMYRLGFSEEVCTERLCARLAWEYESKRPGTLSDEAVAKIVKETYARRPG
jgi:hypothetical protein